MTFDPIAIIGVVAGLVGAAAAFFSFWYNRKEHRLNGLVQAFNILSDTKHREAREHVYASFVIYRDKGHRNKKDTKIFVDGEQKDFTSIVRADLDQMGALVRNGTIQRDGFLRAYGETCYRCWNALRDHVHEEREQRGFEHYMENFEWLSDEAVRFWQKKGINLTSIATF